MSRFSSTVMLLAAAGAMLCLSGAVSAAGHAEPPTEALVTEVIHKTQYADDFGYLVHKYPTYAFCPSTVEQLREIVAWAFENDIPTATRGRGHSTLGQSQSQSAVIDMKCLNSISPPDMENMEITVGAGASWRDLSLYLLGLGMRPVVATNEKSLSIGGTLSIGGFGQSSAHKGAAAHHVVSIDAVDGRGRLITCTPRRRKGLFRSLLGGQGQAAIMATVTVKIEYVAPTFQAWAVLLNDMSDAMWLQTNMSLDNGWGVQSSTFNILPNNPMAIAPISVILAPVKQSLGEQVFDAMFGLNATDYLYLILAVGDNINAAEVPLFGSTHVAFPLAEPGVSSYFAAELADESYQQATTMAEFYSPRHVLHFFIPSSGMKDPGFEHLMASTLEAVKVNPGVTIGGGTIHQSALEGTVPIYAPIPPGNSFNFAIIMAQPYPNPPEQLSAGALSYLWRDVLQQLFQAWQQAYPDITIYPYGFMPDGYTWERHYGEGRFGWYKRLRAHYNPRGIIGRGVDMFDCPV